MEGTMAEVRMFGGSFAPRNWAFCDGQLLSISQYQALFSLLGTTYGGDGRTTFALPDMRGRSCLQQGQGPGLPDYRLGARAGHENTTLTSINMPTHSHSINGSVTVSNVTYPAFNDEADSATPVGNVPAFLENVKQYNSTSDANFMAPPVVNVHMGLGTTITGNSQYFDNHSPYTVVNFIICLFGLYPSRN